jgi:sigma-54 specific flagellar transcriptional regulator A
MSQPELITDEQGLSRAPDLVVSRQAEGVWVVEQVSDALVHWTGLETVGRAVNLRELFPEVSPGLEPLAEEVLSMDQPLKGVRIHFLSPGDCLLQADVLPGGLSADYRHRQVHFHFRPQPVGRARVYGESRRFGLVGESPGMQEVYRKIALYAESDAAVVVTGETGTGKELVARALHEQSPRKENAFVAVNCSAISPELLESELFGHEKGAFTGAVRAHRGRFERAHHGSIFLDEIGDMPLHTQTKLLRVLEEGRLERVGSERDLAVDVRVIGATNVPLEQAVQQGRFRSDLYHRLAVLRVHLPSLRQRPEDVPLLVDHFLSLFRQKYQRSVQRLTHEAMDLLQAYLWPGNVRELRNVLERVFVETQAEVVGARAFKEWVRERQDFSPGDWGPDGLMCVERSPLSPPYPLASEQTLLPLRQYPLITAASGGAIEPPRRSTRPVDLDADEIREAFRATAGNLTAAARLLGVHRATLYRSLARLGISRHNLLD